MTSKSVRRLVVFILSILIITWVISLVKSSIPYSNSDEILSTSISIDSISYFGPTAFIVDKSSRKSYWIKSYTSFKYPNLDSLKSKKASIRYMKFLLGPVENRIVKMEVDSVVIFDQIVDQE